MFLFQSHASESKYDFFDKGQIIKTEVKGHTIRQKQKISYAALLNNISVSWTMRFVYKMYDKSMKIIYWFFVVYFEVNYGLYIIVDIVILWQKFIFWRQLITVSGWHFVMLANLSVDSKGGNMYILQLFNVMYIFNCTKYWWCGTLCFFYGSFLCYCIVIVFYWHSLKVVYISIDRSYTSW